MAINYSANTFDLNPQAEGFNLWPHSDGKANVILHKKHVWFFFLIHTLISAHVMHSLPAAAAFEN